MGITCPCQKPIQRPIILKKKMDVLTRPTNPVEKISNIVRSVTMSDTATTRSGLTGTTATPWEQQSNRRPPSDAGSRYNNAQSTYSRRDSRDTTGQRERVERLTTGAASAISDPRQRQPHSRNGSAAGSSGDYHDGQHTSSGRRHDYDVQAMESDLSPRPGVTKNPIPAPIVTVRSEFPTMNRSRQQQTLTCLITVEVPEGNWRPDADDLRHPPSGQSQLDEPYTGRFGAHRMLGLSSMSRWRIWMRLRRSCGIGSIIGTALSSNGMSLGNAGGVLFEIQFQKC